MRNRAKLMGMNEITEYKTGQLELALNTSSNTIRAWANMYADLLSHGATANKRTFTPDDALLLATVAELRKAGTSFDAIRAGLENGQRIERIPHIPSQQEKEIKQEEGVVLVSQYDGVIAENVQLAKRIEIFEVQLEEKTRALEDANEQLAILKHRLESETSDIREAWQIQVKSLEGEAKQLDSRIKELERDLGRATGRLEELDKIDHAGTIKQLAERDEEIKELTDELGRARGRLEEIDRQGLDTRTWLMLFLAIMAIIVIVALLVVFGQG